VIKSKGVRWQGFVAGVEILINAIKISVEKSQRKKSFAAWA
jgi:hypothetical protein